MPKYNLALTPISMGDEIIRYASQFSTLADKYLLGKNSLPHVTLYQFETEEKLIDNIWKQVEKNWKEDPLELKFEEFSCLSFDKNLFWTSLLPTKCHELHRMHRVIAELLKKPIKEKFDPHMTLFNTKNKDYEKYIDTLKTSYKPISDMFILSLGHSDDIGQLTKILFTQEAKPKINCN